MQQFVAMLMAGASYNPNQYAHDLGSHDRRGRRSRRRMDSQATATTESFSDDEDFDEDEDEEAESLEARSLEGGLSSSLSAPELQHRSHSASSPLRPQDPHTNAIRQQVTQMNLHSKSTTSPTMPASSPAAKTRYPEDIQETIASDASGLRGRSHSESALAFSHPSSRAGAASSDVSSRPSLGGRTRSGSLLKAAVAGASSSALSQHQSTSETGAEITIAVVGDKNVGKSTLISTVLKKSSTFGDIPEVLSTHGPYSSAYRNFDCVFLPSLTLNTQFFHTTPTSWSMVEPESFRSSRSTHPYCPMTAQVSGGRPTFLLSTVPCFATTLPIPKPFLVFDSFWVASGPAEVSRSLAWHASHSPKISPTRLIQWKLSQSASSTQRGSFLWMEASRILNKSKSLLSNGSAATSLRREESSLQRTRQLKGSKNRGPRLTCRLL